MLRRNFFQIIFHRFYHPICSQTKCTVKPIPGIGVYWMTEITHVANRKYFIDEQRFGPYRFWHHQHHFREIEGGVEMTDIVHYRNPLGLLGNLANKLFVKRQLKKIFDYRFRQIEEMFGKWPL